MTNFYHFAGISSFDHAVGIISACLLINEPNLCGAQDVLMSVFLLKGTEKNEKYPTNDIF